MVTYTDTHHCLYITTRSQDYHTDKSPLNTPRTSPSNEDHSHTGEVNKKNNIINQAMVRILPAIHNTQQSEPRKLRQIYRHILVLEKKGRKGGREERLKGVREVGREGGRRG